MSDMSKQIIKAAKSGDQATLTALIAVDINLVHACDRDESTPLQCAAWKGHRALVADLLAAGADVHVHNNNDHWGTTPLHAAAHANQAKIIQLLIDHGADLSAVDMHGNRPLHHTTFYNARAAAKVLHAHGVV